MHSIPSPSYNKRIYFISGFDPRGARFYHRLFREEAKKSEVISGANISTSKSKVVDVDISQWQVNSIWHDKQYVIDYRFMRWEGVINQYWEKNTLLLIMKSLPFYFKHLMAGLFFKFKKAGKGPFLFSIGPFAFSVLSIIALFLAMMLVGMLTFIPYQQWWMSVAAAGLVAYFFTKYVIYFGGKIGFWWVMQSFLLHSRWVENPLPSLEDKMQAFAARIIQDQTDSPVDEIILVGHCTGAALTVCVMDKILNMYHDILKDKLSIITLGQSIPYLSYARNARHFRTSLENFANNHHYPWYDMGARIDPLCFQQVNPAIADGVTLMRKNVPHQFVVKPYKMFSAEKYKLLHKNILRMHFQYLMAADIKTDFDYFEIVTGPPATIKQYIK